MKAVLVLCLIAAAAVAVAAADVSGEKPKKVAPKAKQPVRTLSPKLFMPKSGIVTVPKGDPRAYPPGLAPASSASTSRVLKAGVTTSAACAAQKGTCKASSSCSGSIVRGICPGDSTITCCVPKGSTPSTPSSSCPVYGSAPLQSINGNNNVMYQVVRIAPQHFSGSADNTMTKPTACAFAQMAEAAAKAGIRLTINSGFRTLARQQYFWDCYQTKRCNNGNLAARPGTSNHGRGQALDINTGSMSTATYKWMAANAARFGFRRTVSSEPWHWEH